MAYCGSVTLHDAKGRALHTIRYDACRQYKAASRILPIAHLKPVQLVDAWHALEYVATAARFLEARENCVPGTFRRWKALLLEAPGGAGVRDVLRALEATGARNARDADGRRPVHDAIRYLENRAARMNYAAARARGLAIGSGAVEATCKSLVAIRMKRAGSRWKTETGNEVLALRALQLSDRWQQAISGALKPLVKSVRVTDAPARRRAA